MAQTKTLLEILTPKSPRWDEFANALFEVTRIPNDAEAWLCDGDGSGESNPEPGAPVRKEGHD